jgi:hypothetical protein
MCSCEFWERLALFCRAYARNTFTTKLVEDITSRETHEPRFLLFNIVSIILFYIVPLGSNHVVVSASQ